MSKQVLVPEERVVIGHLKTPEVVMPTDSEGIPFSGVSVYDWDHRAMWSWARLQFGRSIDRRIQDHMSMIETMKNKRLTRRERLYEMKLLFRDLVHEAEKEPRKLQYIFQGREVIAVASLKHLLIPPSEVYDMARQIFSKNFGKPTLKQIGELDGQTYMMKHESGFQLGLQVYGGCITTRRAITLTSWCRVDKCLNTLSWLGSGGFDRFGIGNDYGNFERLLRIKVRSDLQPRLKEAITGSMSSLKSLERKVELAKKEPIEPDDAHTILGAFGLSYGLGARVINQIYKRLEKEPKTLWGMSMAASWVAVHGKKKKTPEGRQRGVEQRLSTIAGASLLVDDIEAVKDECEKWLHDHAPRAYHIKNGKIVKGES